MRTRKRPVIWTCGPMMTVGWIERGGRGGREVRLLLVVLVVLVAVVVLLVLSEGREVGLRVLVDVVVVVVGGVGLVVVVTGWAAAIIFLILIFAFCFLLLFFCFLGCWSGNCPVEASWDKYYEFGRGWMEYIYAVRGAAGVAEIRVGT